MTKSRGVRTPRGTAMRYFEAHIHDQTDDCMIWPYAADKDGYGYLWRPGAGRYTRVGVLACTYRNGPMPRPGMVAAHGTCHDVRCWNPRHLTWKTHYENAQDRKRDGTTLHGEANHRAKLTEELVLQIRALHREGNSQTEIGRRIGVTSKLVNSIVLRRRWAHLP